MRTTRKLHELGQSIWLDNITRDLLNDGTLRRYIDELSVTGLTSNPTIFDHAIKNSTAYDAAIRDELASGRRGEELFFALALEDLTRAADLFRPIHDRTAGVDGWVSLEVSPVLAHDTASTLAAAKELFARAGRRNLFIKIPGTKEGLPAIEEAIFAGVPVNVTLLFSREQYLAAAEAFLPRHRAAHRRRPGAGRRVGRLGVRQPLGCRRRGQGARPAREHARHRGREADLRGVPRAPRLAALAARRERRGSTATPALGEHGNEGPARVGRPLREGARRAVHGQHHARGDAEGARRPREDRRAAAGRRRRLPRRCSRRSPTAGSTSTPWPPDSRTRARRHS